MSWIDILDGNEFLKMLFPADAPTLDSVCLHEVQLHHDGPVVSLRFDLEEFPKEPPPKWQMAKSNTVQVRLAGIDVVKVSVDGWARNNVGRLVIEREASGFRVEFQSDKCRISSIVNYLRVESVTAYRDELRVEGDSQPI